MYIQQAEIGGEGIRSSASHNLQTRRKHIAQESCKENVQDSLKNGKALGGAAGPRGHGVKSKRNNLKRNTADGFP